MEWRVKSRDKSRARRDKRCMIEAKSSLLALSLIIIGSIVSAEANQDAPMSSKFEFWRRILSETLASGAKTSEVESLARRLSEQSDQQKSALFFIDLASSQNQPSELSCLRVSFAEILATEEQARSSGLERGQTADGLDIYERKLGQLVQLNELAGLEQVNSASGLVEAAKIAAENANLVSRLLIRRQDHRDLIDGLASRDFYRYLLSNGLSRLTGRDSSAIHSVGFVFLSGHERLQVEWAPFARVRPSSAHSDFGQLEELSGSSNETLSWPLVARWLIADRSKDPQMLELRSRLASSSSSSPLKPSDGRWFSPHLDCKTRRWLLDFSLPFFTFNPYGQGGEKSSEIQLK